MTDQSKPLTDEELTHLEARLQHGATPSDQVVSHEDFLRLIAELRQLHGLIREVLGGPYIRVEPMANGRCLWCASRRTGKKEPHEDDCPWLALQTVVGSRPE